MMPFRITRRGVKLLILVAIVVFTGYAWLSSRQSEKVPGEVAGETIRSEEGTTRLVAEQAASVEDITKKFTSHYATALTWQDEKAARQAKELLTERGKYVMEAGDTVFDGLQRFTGNLPAPEQAIVSESHKRSEQFAEVIVEWQYPLESATRYFYFTLEEGSWKLDSIQTVRQ